MEPKDALAAAIAAVNEVADGADDSELTPSEIARLIRRVLAGTPEGRARRYLDEALDAVADGMPGDTVATLLYAALGALTENSQPT